MSWQRWNVSLGMLSLWSAVLFSPACSRQQPAAMSRADSLAGFSTKVDEYVALRNRLADTMGPIDETKSQAEIASRAATLAHLIQNERANAKQGDLFTPEAAAVITAIIQQEYRTKPDSVKEQREVQEKEYREDGLPEYTPKVDTLYPTTYPLTTFPPQLLPLLPQLPPQVEYRILSHYLLLRDIEANLILDFIPHAVP